MIDLAQLNNNIDEAQKAIASRGEQINLSTLLDISKEKNLIQLSLDDLKNKKNIISKSIGELAKQNENIDEEKLKSDKISAEINNLQDKFNELDAQLTAMLLTIPNIPDKDVPIGNDENANEVMDVKIYQQNDGEDHVEIGNKLGLLDFETANKLSGARFVVLKGKLAKLQRALIQFMLDHADQNGYEECYVPYIVNKESLLGTGQLPKFEDDQFKVNESNYLIPTAEVPLTNFVRDTQIDAKDLPIKLCAHTPCFRSEAGSYGKDTKGMIRQHQFEKVEIVQIVHPNNSEGTLDELVANATKILDELKLSYRTVKLCTGDLGFSAAKTIDIEVWLPSQNTFREISSCSNFRDYQARRMHTRSKDNDGKFIPHTLNGSALAVGRTLVAIMENFYDPKKGLIIPDALHKYLDFTIIPLK